MERFLQAETLIIELLLVVSLVAIVVRRLRIPYTVALVLVGLVITSQQPIKIDLRECLEIDCGRLKSRQFTAKPTSIGS